MNSLKYLSYYLIFRDCLNDVDNLYHDSLFSRIWLEKIENDNVRANREQAYTKEWLDTIKKPIYEFIQMQNIQITAEDEVLEYFKHYFSSISDIDFKCNLSMSSPEFSDIDRIHLTRAYLDLKKDSNFALVVLYYPVSEHWEYIKEKIRKNNFNIVSEYVLDFFGNLLGFENMLHDIYEDYNSDESSLIQRKIALLIKSKLIIKIVAIDEKVQTQDFYTRLETLKLSLRDILTFSSDKNAFLNLHAPGDRAEAEHLKHVLASVNNLWYIRNRLVNSNQLIFSEKIQKMSQTIRRCKENVYDFVVIDSGVMDAVGIWKCNDIEIITNQKVGKIEDANIFKEQYNMFVQSKRKLSNQAILNDDNNYFYCYGMKFCNLDLVWERNLYYSNQQNDNNKKVECINSYYNFINFIDDKKVLNDEIQIEFQRRKIELKSNRCLIYRCINKIKRMAKKVYEYEGIK